MGLNKVASSSLTSAFLLASDYNQASLSSPHSLSQRLQPKSLDEFRLANSSYFKFMFVRHPMERLLSCYLDKMVTSTHWSLPAFRRYVQHKASQILGRPATGQTPTGTPTFQEFLEFVLS